MATVDRYDFPADRWYEPREHLWVLPDAPGGDAPAVVTVGVDALGQELLGDVAYVELPRPGAEVRRGEAVGTLEAEKMVRPIVAPVSGAVLAVNEALLATPRLLNQEPYGRGWLVRVRASRWHAERDALLHGEAGVVDWARREIEANR
jgi:glycine cleavage system H protein